jgi:hypothetical protein
MTGTSFAARAMTEAQLQDSVTALAQLYGWRVFHDQDSRRNAPGLPDLVMVGHGRLILAELKTETGRLRPAQREWMRELQAVTRPPETFLWRPSSWLDQTIRKELQ